MTKKFLFIIYTMVVLMCPSMLIAQDTSVRIWNHPNQNRVIETQYDPHLNKVIPDKVFEFGIPLLLIFMVLNTIISIFKIKADVQLKAKAMDKGISEATLIELFREDKQMLKNIYLKWFLVLAAIGIALIYVHMLHQYVKMSSGYLALGIISLLISIAFLIYYRIIRKR